jgi:hypothetical protein
MAKLTLIVAIVVAQNENLTVFFSYSSLARVKTTKAAISAN